MQVLCRASHGGGLLLLLLLDAAENLMHSGGDVLDRPHLGVILHLPSKRESDAITGFSFIEMETQRTLAARATARATSLNARFVSTGLN